MRTPVRRGVRRPLLRTGPLVLVAALAVALAGCSDEGTEGVRVAAATLGTVAEVVEAPATVTALATATVTAGAAGTVTDLRVADGQQVRRGQVLLRVESPQARRSLRQALRADADAAAAGATGAVPTTPAGTATADADARAAFERARRSAQAIPDPAARSQALAALRVSQSQYQAARASADLAAAQLAAGLGSLSAAVEALASAQRVQTRAAVDSARRTLASLTIRAPIAGIVSLTPDEVASATGAEDLLSQLPEALQSQAGQALGGGGTSSVVTTVADGAPVTDGQPLVTVTDASSLSLTAQVDETDVLLVQPGVTASAELDAVPDATYEAAVTTVDPTPTTASRGGVSYVVRLSLGPGTGPDGAAAAAPRPGMSAVVDLRVRTSKGVVTVPAPAVFRDGRADRVYVVKNGIARKRTVRLGAQGDVDIEVVEGLEEGERLVVRGADRVQDGQRVG